MLKPWINPLHALFMLSLGATASVAQTKVADMSAGVRQCVEAMLRSKAEFPSATTLTFNDLGTSEIPDFEKLQAHFASAVTGEKGDLSLLISKDGTRIAQFTTYDIAANPRSKIPVDGRPGRGGPPTAPVLVVGFDDLECPYCAHLHREFFPALTDRYKDQVRFVYQSLPSDGHPWAMRAAVDTDCLGRENPSAYWAAVDDIHAHRQSTADQNISWPW